VSDGISGVLAGAVGGLVAFAFARRMGMDFPAIIDTAVAVKP